MSAPQRTDLLGIIDLLMSEDLSREEVSAWASERHVEPAEDPLVEEALDILALIDARHVSAEGQPLGYMYDLSEVAAARQALTRGDDG
jgi:hypothetical protein